MTASSFSGSKPESCKRRSGVGTLLSQGGRSGHELVFPSSLRRTTIPVTAVRGHRAACGDAGPGSNFLLCRGRDTAQFLPWGLVQCLQEACPSNRGRQRALEPQPTARRLGRQGPMAQAPGLPASHGCSRKNPRLCPGAQELGLPWHGERRRPPACHPLPAWGGVLP